MFPTDINSTKAVHVFMHEYFLLDDQSDHSSFPHSFGKNQSVSDSYTLKQKQNTKEISGIFFAWLAAQ